MGARRLGSEGAFFNRTESGMSGRYVRLTSGRYTLAVAEGEGPAGIHRCGEQGGVSVDIDGGRVDFTVGSDEDAYYWWRGPRERTGVRLFGVSRGESIPERSEVAWPAATTA